MAKSDIGALTASKNVKLVAVSDVDKDRAAWIAKDFPDCKIYEDWREMFAKEKFDSANISCPDHMHAVPTMRAIRMGKHVYTQKPLTQTIYEARQLTLAAKDKKIVSQMGTQLHSGAQHRTVVAAIHSGIIGKVKEVHSWSGKDWGDPADRPDKSDPIPKNLNWDLWLGVAEETPFLGGSYYHPGNWRKRLNFGTGTFGDMGCHILDPVYGSLGVGMPKAVKSVGEAPNKHNWPLNCEVQFAYPGSKYTTETATITWYNGKNRPPEAIAKLVEPHKIPLQGSIYIGTEGVLYSPYGEMPIAMNSDKKITPEKGSNHYLQFVDAVLGNGKTTAPFDYAGPLTEMVLLGCLSTRFQGVNLEWDAEKMVVTNHAAANKFVRREYRKGWAEEGF